MPFVVVLVMVVVGVGVGVGDEDEDDGASSIAAASTYLQQTIFGFVLLEYRNLLLLPVD